MSLEKHVQEKGKDTKRSNMMAETLEDLQFDNSYARLPETFYQRLHPTAVKEPKLIKLNYKLSETLGLNPLTIGQTDHEILAGNRVPKQADPIAMVYAGHQFGNWVPQLGDGRAVLLGELLNKEGQRWDLQLKGSGPTEYSRMGDGRAVLGPVMREYIVSEAMFNLGIPTTRALAFSMTGEMVRREYMEPGAILTRVASSHIRVGTFQYFHGKGDEDAIKILADYAIKRHYPHAEFAEQPYLTLLDSVIQNTAELISAWMLVGFIHGVMNTDNTAISGETIDYGPCAFMDGFNPNKTFSSIDSGGRYAYNHQPMIGQWNLTRFAETLLKLLDENQDNSIKIAKASIENFWFFFEKAFHEGLCKKIGLTASNKGNTKLAFDFLDLLSKSNVDFTTAYRSLSNYLGEESETNFTNLFDSKHDIENWLARWSDQLVSEGKGTEEIKKKMNSVNPAFIPRNHQVEKAIDLATSTEDFGLMEDLIAVLDAPFENNQRLYDLSLPPKKGEEVTQTFCGT